MNLDERTTDRRSSPNSPARPPALVLAASSLVLVCAVGWIVWQARGVDRRAESDKARSLAWPRSPWKKCTST